MEWRGHCNTLTYCGNERWVGKLSAVQGAPPQRKRAGRRLKAKKKLRPFVVCPVQRRGRRSGTGPSEPGAPPPAMTFTAPVNEARGGPTLMRGCTAPYRRRPYRHLTDDSCTKGGREDMQVVHAAPTATIAWDNKVSASVLLGRC